MKNKLLIILLLISSALSAQLTAPIYHRLQIGANWNFNEDTVHINRLHVGDGKFGIDSLGRIIYYNNAVPTAGKLLYGNGTYFNTLSIGTANQVLRVNAGATAPEWWTPSLGPSGVTGLTQDLILFGKADGTIEQDAEFKLTSEFYSGYFSHLDGGLQIGGTSGSYSEFNNEGVLTDYYNAAINDGDILYGNSTGMYILPLGNAGQALRVKSDGTNVEWGSSTGLAQAPTELTAQTASIGATTFYTTPAADGWYRITITGTITTAAGTSLDLAVQLRYTEATDNVAKTFPNTNVNGMNRTATNTTAASVSITSVCHIKASTNVQYITSFSFSGGAPQYNLHATIEKLTY